MTSYVLTGKVIGAENRPAEGLRVQAWDDDPWINPDDLLGEVATGPDGRFRLEFDEAAFAPIWEFLEGSPDVYLVILREGKEILRTRVQKTRKEIDYHIRLAEHVPDPNAKDIYAANLRRLTSSLGDVGNILAIEYRIDLDTLGNVDLEADIRRGLEGLASGFEERQSNFNHFVAILNGLVTGVLEERRLGTIGYDGPQVPRLPRREAYVQAVVWPRAEAFRWE